MKNSRIVLPLHNWIEDDFAITNGKPYAIRVIITKARGSEKNERKRTD
jgi:hypothetical protein